MTKLIATGFSPNLTSDQIWRAMRVLLQPYRWWEGTDLRTVWSLISERYQNEHIHLTSSGRYALYKSLKKSDVREGDEVLIQGFTCVAVSNAVKWTGARPVYYDIDSETLNADLQKLEEKITEKTKAVVIQHTFGLGFQEWEALRGIINDRGIKIIEDCAHAFGASMNGQQLGTFGDFAAFSFGRDKVVSSVFGGFVMVNNPTIEKVFQKGPNARMEWILHQLLHPILSGLILVTYNWMGIGKVIHWLSNRLNLMSRATSSEEKKSGSIPAWVHSGFPNGLAMLVFRQVERLDILNLRRLEIAQQYSEAGIRSAQPFKGGRVWLRYPLRVRDPHEMHAFFRSRGIALGDWYDQVVGPKEVTLDKAGYHNGDSPVAEKVSREIVNLPTNPTLSDEQVQKVIKVYRLYDQESSIEILEREEHAFATEDRSMIV